MMPVIPSAPPVARFLALIQLLPADRLYSRQPACQTLIMLILAPILLAVMTWLPLKRGLVLERTTLGPGYLTSAITTALLAPATLRSHRIVRLARRVWP